VTLGVLEKKRELLAALDAYLARASK